MSIGTDTINRDTIRVGLLQDLDDFGIDDVHALVHDVYVQQGYIKPRESGMLQLYPRLDGIPETRVLVAVEDHTLIGTCSLTLDGPLGLHTDSDFRAETDRLREVTVGLGASWRIATAPQCRVRHRVVLEIVRRAIRHAAEMGIDTALCTFNPKHERFYAKVLNMKVVSYRDSTEGLFGAPAVLMRWDLTETDIAWFR